MPLWPNVVVCGLFEATLDTDKLLALLNSCEEIQLPSDITVSNVQDKDWARAWMDDFEPMKFGAGLWIVPGDMEAPKDAVTIIRLDPGLAFGSGTHPTTALCLEWIDAQLLEERSVLDFGCGSGVLGIAAALKGAGPVTCIDNDPQAIIATTDNAVRNGVDSRLTAKEAALPEDGAVDFILANILAGTLVKLVSELCNSLQSGGQLALSGILVEQAPEVVSVYSNWLDNIEQKEQDNWVLITGKRR